MILNESKRDELLLPYLNILKENGVEMSLGKFKGVMLDKLGAQGGLHNLSKASNFYLAGATRYYFNGDLTTNRDLSVLKGDPSATDNWNIEICQRLDALIDILRNAYIDSVGQTWEQPEDFGNLPIQKLLKKYGKKINMALGIDDKQKVEADDEGEDLNPHVGNGYTFHILYKYEDGTKYAPYTAPGSWCITYGIQHYNNYIRNLNIHYVIFLKDGYENVKRKIGPGFTKDKPHDEYGNSMIALLQSNVDGQPVYITSRWNHGHYSDGTSGTEADSAYTPSEFYKITGVTPEDLQNIFQEWKKNAKKNRPKREIDPSQKEKKLEILRSLKYIQMRINGGEDPNGLITPYKMLYGKMPDRLEDGSRGPVNYRASVLECFISSESGERIYFMIDKGRIVFETIVYNVTSTWDFVLESAEKYYENTYGDMGEDHTSGRMHNIVIFKGTGGGYGLYDVRRHAFVEVDGTKRFKAIPSKYGDYGSSNAPQFYQVKQSTKEIALINISNNMPLRLPNGSFWFDDMSSNKTKSNRDNYSRSLSADFVATNEDILLEIVYDSSSGEKYFYSVKGRRFINLPNIDMGEDHHPYLTRQSVDDYQVILFRESQHWSPDCLILVDKNGELGSIGPFTKFLKIESYYLTKDTIITFVPKCDEGEPNYGYEAKLGSRSLVYNILKKKIPMLNGDYLYVNSITSTWSDNAYAILNTPMQNNEDTILMVYDIENDAILLNPYGYPDKMHFAGAGQCSKTMMKVYKGPHRQFRWSERYESNHEFADATTTVNFKELKLLKLDDRQPYSASVGREEPMQSLAEKITFDDIRHMVSESIKRVLRNGK